ncbi:MAG TPA: 16S rRNA (cytosine(1402)-N(4))-methyltransferase RsmH [Gemmataceae bacterium]|nr:16S rRNA (cytosine(1402)-N(4))-methyltransferase RsmH [Gemmataceae bacterium]
MPRPQRQRSTPEGEHLPVMLAEVLAALAPHPGETAVDCTLGFGGHAIELLRRVQPGGRLIGLDLDAANLDPVRQRLAQVGGTYSLHHSNYAGLAGILANEGVLADVILADLGMSSMQVDDANRGFAFMRDGPLDMRMDPTRGRSAAELLATLSQAELAGAFRDLGDEPDAEKIAAAIVAQRSHKSVQRTGELMKLIQEAAPVKVAKGPGQPTPWQQRIRPVARVFQALRILVNRELANLEHLLRILPECLNSGGRAAIISFHSGEDRLVKQAFRDGLRAGIYAAVSDEPIRADFAERQRNPRARSAKLRWAKKPN